MRKTDVIVCGGGPAGVAAAITAASCGAKVSLVERYNALGGLTTMGYVTTIPLPPSNQPKVLKSVLKELSKIGRLHKFKKGKIKVVACNPETLKLALDEMAVRAGVDVFFETVVVRCTSSYGEIKKIMVKDGGGTWECSAPVVIDTTGDGEVASAAGVPFRMEKNKLLPVTLMYMIGGADNERFQSYLCKDPELKTAAQKARFRYRTHLGVRKEFQGPAVVPLDPIEKGMVLVWSNSITINPLDPVEKRRALISLRKQAWVELEFLRNHVPGFEESYIVSTASYLGVRETRRVVGGYVLKEGDFKRRFSDNVGRLWYSGEPNRFYPLPYRCLLPKGVKNLLVAGRCFSATHSVQNKLREIPACMVMGEAAGAAAAISVKRGISVREVQPAEIKRKINKTAFISDRIK